MKLEGKVALVTGGASGRGREVVRLIAAEGAGIVVFDRDGEGAQRVADEVRAAGVRALAHEGDVTRAADFDAAIARARDELGGFDVIHNNAGV